MSFFLVVISLFVAHRLFFFFHLSSSAVVLVGVAVTIYGGRMFFNTCGAGECFAPIASWICFVRLVPP